MDKPEIPGAIRPEGAVPAKGRMTNRALLIGGIGIFVIGVALLVIAIAFFAGSLR